MLRCFLGIMRRTNQKYEFEEKNEHRKLIFLNEATTNLIGKNTFPQAMIILGIMIPRLH